jgi:urease accessory protein
LVKHGALPEERIRAVETGGCPHAAIREDISINLGPLEELSNLYKADLLLCESGGGIFLVDFNIESSITICLNRLQSILVQFGR